MCAVHLHDCTVHVPLEVESSLLLHERNHAPLQHSLKVTGVAVLCMCCATVGLAAVCCGRCRGAKLVGPSECPCLGTWL